MSPAEAGAIEYEEPNWYDVWDELLEETAARHPYWTAYQYGIDAFEEILKRWRRFHWTPVEVKGEQKKQAASARDGIIALAILGIMPPRFEIKDVPRTNAMGFQCDEHMWLSISGEQWRITAIEDRILFLVKENEARQIDLNRARWDKYIETATSMFMSRLEASFVGLL